MNRNPVKKKNIIFFLIGYSFITALFGVLFILKNPNLHRIRASLIYRQIESDIIHTRNTGLILKSGKPPYLIVNHASKLLGNLQKSEDTWKKALALANLNRGKEKDIPFTSCYSEEKYLLDIIYLGKGKCSDYTEAFSSLCAVSGVSVREWGITPSHLKDRFGHSVTEIYDVKNHKWSIIDPIKSAWPALKTSPNKPIGVSELIQSPPEEILWHPINDEYYNTEEIKISYGKRPLSAFIIGNQKLFNQRILGINPKMNQLINLILGRSFYFMIPNIPTNSDFISDLRTLLYIIYILMFLFIPVPFFLVYVYHNKILKKSIKKEA